MNRLTTNHYTPQRALSNGTTGGIAGRLYLTVYDSLHQQVCERQIRNTVMRSGAELIAALFSGAVSTPVNGIGVGIDNTPSSPPYEATTLTTTFPDGTPALEQATIALDPGALKASVVANEFKVRVSVHAVIPATHAISPNPDDPRVLISEAALGILAEDSNSLSKLYNRVVFEPIPKTSDHVITLYWEIDFPYGP
jgi:hypothetical protein